MKSEIVKTKSKPEFVKEEHLKFLDGLRESGAVNMFGAGQELDVEFPELSEGRTGRFHSSNKARAVLDYWMETFEERHP